MTATSTTLVTTTRTDTLLDQALRDHRSDLETLLENQIRGNQAALQAVQGKLAELTTENAGLKVNAAGTDSAAPRPKNHRVR